MLLVAGPRTTRSREQVLATARGLAQAGSITFFGTAVWKPGIPGEPEDALTWLVEAQESLGLAACVQVGTPGQVESVLRHGIRAVWLDGGTTGDPFAVEELASAVRGAPLRILVANPYSPDPAPWLRAVERMAVACGEHVIAVHRGFPCAEQPRCRRTPMWHVATELHRELPAVPVICEPTAVAGSVHAALQVSRTALALGMSGLMIAVAHESSSISDLPGGHGELSLREMAALLEALDHASRRSPGGGAQPELRRLRDELSRIDDQILVALSARWALVQRLSAVKQSAGLSLYQPDQRAETQQRWRERSAELGLPPEVAGFVYSWIHEASLCAQMADRLQEPDEDPAEATARRSPP